MRRVLFRSYFSGCHADLHVYCFRAATLSCWGRKTITEFGDLARLKGRVGALPPYMASALVPNPRSESEPIEEPVAEAEPISAFLCIIEYLDETRPITCRRYERIGAMGYVGAICHLAGGYRQFRCDRITAVFDAHNGELLGCGQFFARFRLEPRTFGKEWVSSCDSRCSRDL